MRLLQPRRIRSRSGATASSGRESAPTAAAQAQGRRPKGRRPKGRRPQGAAEAGGFPSGSKAKEGRRAQASLFPQKAKDGRRFLVRQSASGEKVIVRALRTGEDPRAAVKAEMKKLAAAATAPAKVAKPAAPKPVVVAKPVAPKPPAPRPVAPAKVAVVPPPKPKPKPKPVAPKPAAGAAEMIAAASASVDSKSPPKTAPDLPDPDEAPDTASVPPRAPGSGSPTGYKHSLADFGLSEGDVIDASNVEEHADIISPGLKWGVGYGWRLNMTEPVPIRMPKHYAEITEKFSPQVKLGPNGTLLENYVAGMPFPNVDSNDPWPPTRSCGISTTTGGSPMIST